MCQAARSATTWLMVRAPRLPPNESRQTCPGRTPSFARAPSRSARRISGRTGLPVTMVLWGTPSFSTASGMAANTASTCFAKILLVTPGKAFCSWMAVGMPCFAALSTTGPLT